PALMPGLARERRAEEDLDEVDGVGDVVHPCSERQDVRVVVGAGERGGLLAPRQRGAYTGDLVGGDLLTVAGSADHDAEAVPIGDNGLTRGDAQRRVVVVGVVRMSAVIGD